MATSASIAARAALAHARTFRGYKESPARSNRTRFGRQFGWDGVAWCAIFVWCILQDTGSSAALVKSASTGAIERWGKSVGRFSRTPHVGDVIILRNAKGATAHTELVYSWDGRRLLGIGGNTSGGPGSIADGGTVAINDRTDLYRAGRITFVRPFYGVTMEDVRVVQAAVGVPATGNIDAATVAAVKRAQARLGLKVDGFPGPKTIAALTGQGAAAVASSGAAVRVSYDRAMHSEVQRRMGLPVDGRLGPGDVRALQGFFDLPQDGQISNQVRTAGEVGDAINPAIWEHDTKHQGPSSILVRCLQAYVGAEVDRGQWGPGLTGRWSTFMAQEPGLFTPADKGIALQRTAGLR